MSENEKIQEAIFAGIDDYNSTVPEEDMIHKVPETILFDQSGKLDSMGYIALSVAIEKRIQAELGEAIALFSKYTDCPIKEPLKTVSSLVDYVAWLIARNQGGT